MKIRFYMVVAAALAAVMAGFLFLHQVRQQNEMSAYFSETGNRVFELEKEKSAILKELNEIQTEYKEKMHGNAYLRLLITEPRVEVYTDIYPLLLANDISAILVLSIDAMPGDEGYMSLSQFDELLESGWDYCIYYDRSYAAYDNWFEVIDDKLADCGLRMPKNIYISAGSYSDDISEQLMEEGITRVFHESEDYIFYEPVTDENPLWQISTVSWRKKGVESLLSSVVESGGDLFFKIGFSTDEEIYDAERFTIMLNVLLEYQANEQLLLLNFDEIEELRLAINDERAVWINEMQAETDRLNSELARVKEETRQAYAQG